MLILLVQGPYVVSFEKWSIYMKNFCPFKSFSDSWNLFVLCLQAVRNCNFVLKGETLVEPFNLSLFFYKLKDPLETNLCVFKPDYLWQCLPVGPVQSEFCFLAFLNVLFLKLPGRALTPELFYAFGGSVISVCLSCFDTLKFVHMLWY